MHSGEEDPFPELGLRPLSARSVVLSLLLGAHPPQLPARQLVRCVEEFGVSEATLRVALTRMVSAGDLTRDGAVYRLSERLIERQRTQDALMNPRVVAWNGDWQLTVVIATGRSRPERNDLRAALTSLRLAELREGVWLRPSNLSDEPADGWSSLRGQVTEATRQFLSRPDGDPAELAHTLWPLESWAAAARNLVRGLGATNRPEHRFATATAIPRHLLLDPMLPNELLPADWPAGELRDAYGRYLEELTAIARSGEDSGAGDHARADRMASLD
ncbi:PaaX family transcriptional regulator C-terminal domain-containing protein [Nocardia asteroides]|uniref:PaaX family transcriptional regulator C-terminal domain-containing protein n=1 Tax=Nocardia asteroides TaxID=1824 RepID=UPI0037AE38B7